MPHVTRPHARRTRSGSGHKPSCAERGALRRVRGSGPLHSIPQSLWPEPRTGCPASSGPTLGAPGACQVPQWHLAPSEGPCTCLTCVAPAPSTRLPSIPVAGASHGMSRVIRPHARRTRGVSGATSGILRRARGLHLLDVRGAGPFNSPTLDPVAGASHGMSRVTRPHARRTRGVSGHKWPCAERGAMHLLDVRGAGPFTRLPSTRWPAPRTGCPASSGPTLGAPGQVRCHSGILRRARGHAPACVRGAGPFTRIPPTRWPAPRTGCPASPGPTLGAPGACRAQVVLRRARGHAPACVRGAGPFTRIPPTRWPAPRTGCPASPGPTLGAPGAWQVPQVVLRRARGLCAACVAPAPITPSNPILVAGASHGIPHVTRPHARRTRSGAGQAVLRRARGLALRHATIVTTRVAV
jgi:hypothetical protein